MAKDRYAKYASRSERDLDELHERHLNYLCDHATCSWCIADEVEQMAEYYDKQSDQQLCKHCGSIEFVRDGDVEKCASCGK